MFASFAQNLIDFIFPKSEEVYHLESLSAGELIEKLSKAREIKDENLIVLFDYKDPMVKTLIWELKYKGNRKIAEKFAAILKDVLQHELAERVLFENFINPLLIPMPISNKRRRERGWNQVEILAEEIMKNFAVSPRNSEKELFECSPKVLVKHIHTDSQARTHATKRERLENLSGSMSVQNAGKIRGRNIILLDDVTTTGSTFTEAKRVLKESGVKKILCVALAH